MQKISKIVGLCFEGEVGKNFSNPNFSPNFWERDLKFYVPLDIYTAHFRFEFQDPFPKIGAWEDDRRNQKIRIFRKKVPFSYLVTRENTKHK